MSSRLASDDNVSTTLTAHISRIDNEMEATLIIGDIKLLSQLLLVSYIDTQYS